MSGPEIITLGCRLNIAESEAMRLVAADQDDLIIVNSCAVTAEAVRHTRQAIRKAHKARPDARIVVTGCAAQIEPQSFAAMPEVALVLGNAEKLDSAHLHPRLPNPFIPSEVEGLVRAEPRTEERAETSLGSARLSPSTSIHRIEVYPERLPWQAVEGLGINGSKASAEIHVSDILAVRQTAPHLAASFADNTRAFVEVQNGCDHRCTFCVIPYGRGNSRSVPAGAVIDRIRSLVDDGYREVVLTGVDLTSYGPDLPGEQTLGTLVERILAHVPALPRLRLSSLDSVEIDEKLFDLITGEPRLMPHLHLSLQAGDDMILKRMKRRHSRAQSIAIIERLKTARPDIAIGADLIAGFPTETEAMFANTLALLDDCDIVHAHIFPYSPRSGTPAARMPQVEREVAKARARKLREAATVRHRRWLETLMGTTQDVLIERDGGGHAPNFARFAPMFENTNAVGGIVKARVTGIEGDRLIGHPHG